MSEIKAHAQARGQHLFIAFEPKAVRLLVAVTARRTAADFAEQIRRLVDEDYPHARPGGAGQPQHPHPGGAVPGVAPAEAFASCGGGISKAEVEWSVLQCSISLYVLTREVAAWEQDRNAAKATVAWRFTASLHQAGAALPRAIISTRL